jgi:hypothetical protein
VFAWVTNRIRHMTWRPKSLQRLAVAAVVLPSLAAAAAVKPNPYEKIPDRNVFHLQSIPEQPAGEIQQQRPRTPPKIFITGLVELGGVSKALVEINEPGQPVQRSILAAGGAAGLLEILNVDVQGEKVRVRIDGDEETLNIEKPKPITAVPPPRNTPMPPMPPLPQRPPAVLRG